jgi:hypothetical protein
VKLVPRVDQLCDQTFPTFFTRSQNAPLPMHSGVLSRTVGLLLAKVAENSRGDVPSKCMPKRM